MTKDVELTRFATAALELQTFCQSRDRTFCFIGGMAFQVWGLPRATVDADVTLLPGFRGEEPIIELKEQPEILQNRLHQNSECFRICDKLGWLQSFHNSSLR